MTESNLKIINNQYFNRIFSKNNTLYKLIEYIDFDTVIEQFEKELIDTKTYLTLNGKKLTTSTKVDLLFSKLAEFLRDKLRFINDKLFYIGNNKWEVIDIVSPDRFAIFIDAIFHNITELSGEANIKISKRLITILQVPVNNNEVIQFNDAYIENNQLIKGIFTKGFPMFIIERDVLNVWHNNKPTKIVKEIDQLLTNLAGDEETKDYLIRDLALSLIINYKTIAAIGKSAILYGKLGGEGKSTLGNILNKALGIENITEFELDDLGGNAMANVLSSLLAIDSDATNDFVNGKSASNFKKIVTADQVQYKKLYEDVTKRRALTTLLLFTNNQPKISDKSNGFTRRIDIFEMKMQLIPYLNSLNVNIPDWFVTINSEDAATYLFDLLLLKAKDIIERTSYYQSQPDSERLKRTKESFKGSNNHLFDYFETIDLADEVIGFHKNNVYSNYYNWTVDTHEKPFGKNQFFNHLAVELNVIPKKVSASNMNELSPDFIEYMSSNNNKRINNVLMLANNNTID